MDLWAKNPPNKLSPTGEDYYSQSWLTRLGSKVTGAWFLLGLLLARMKSTEFRII